MRVLLIHNAYQQPGGEDSVVAEEAATLRADGHDVHVHLVSNDSIKSPLSRVQTFLRVAYNPQARRDVVTLAREMRPDVAHVHNFFPRLSPSVFDAFIDAGVPSVMTLHNFRLLCPTATLHHRGRTEERSLKGSCWWTVPARAYRGSLVGTLAVAAMVERHKRAGTWRDKVGRFIALSEVARDKFVEGGLPPERITVKPNAVAVPPGGVGEAARAGALFVGRLAEDKGVRRLVEAWRSLDQPLTLVGDGPLRSWVERHAPANVRVLGRLPPSEVAGWMRASALLIVPSLWREMLPMTVLEAFANGLPVLASDTLSLRALVIQHGLQAGALTPPDDASALAAAARDALGDPARLAAWGEAARTLHARFYTPQVNGRRLADIYREVVAEGPRRAPGRARRPSTVRQGAAALRPGLAAT